MYITIFLKIMCFSICLPRLLLAVFGSAAPPAKIEIDHMSYEGAISPPATAEPGRRGRKLSADSQLSQLSTGSLHCIDPDHVFTFQLSMNNPHEIHSLFDETASTRRQVEQSFISWLEQSQSGRSPEWINCAMTIAASGGFCRAIDLLVTAGAKVNGLDRIGAAPLIIAAQAGQISSLNYLLKLGAALDVRDGQGGTILHHAAGAGQAGALGFILAQLKREHRDAALNAVDDDGNTPLHVAVMMSSFSCVEVLHYELADHRIKNIKRQTAGDLAIIKLAADTEASTELTQLARRLNDFQWSLECSISVFANAPRRAIPLALMNSWLASKRSMNTKFDLLDKVEEE